MPKLGPRTTYKYSDEFKGIAVRLSQSPGVETQDLAASLYIHPFMLFRWGEVTREGRLNTKAVEIDKVSKVELKALRNMKRD